MPSTRRYSDPFDYDRFKAFAKFRAQVNFRNEGCDLTLGDWFTIWSDPKVWEQRGRSPTSFCITRLDNTQPWRASNIELITRLEHITKKNKTRKPKVYEVGL